MSEPIVINLVSSRQAISQQMLDNCYFFEIEDGKFSLFSAANVLLKECLETCHDFDFNLGPFNFAVSNFVISKTGGPIGKGHARGDWEANKPGLGRIPRPSIHDADDEGTFQAQAGGHGQDKYSSASAR